MVVRRDLLTPHAQLGHAAAQSARLATEYPDDTHLIVLAARDEAELLAVGERLTAAGIRHVIFREPDAPYHGAATALGITPGPRAPVRKLLSDLPLLR